jgi:hypothetical protein
MERALEREPNDGVLLVNSAWILAKSGDLGRAAELAERGRRALPDVPEAAAVLEWIRRTEAAVATGIRRLS